MERNKEKERNMYFVTVCDYMKINLKWWWLSCGWTSSNISYQTKLKDFFLMERERKKMGRGERASRRGKRVSEKGGNSNFLNFVPPSSLGFIYISIHFFVCWYHIFVHFRNSGFLVCNSKLSESEPSKNEKIGEWVEWNSNENGGGEKRESKPGKLGKHLQNSSWEKMREKERKHSSEDLNTQWTSTASAACWMHKHFSCNYPVKRVEVCSLFQLTSLLSLSLSLLFFSFSVCPSHLEVSDFKWEEEG